jgi:large subunit ribosomal protein L10Ae
MNEHILKELRGIRPNTTKRTFLQTLELQIKLKGYNNIIIKNVILPYKVRLKPLNICFFVNYKHYQDAEDLNIATLCEDKLQTLKKDKVLQNNLIKTYDIFFCSDTIIRKLPRLIGPEFYKKGKYPVVVRSDDVLTNIIDIEARKIRWKFKKNNTQNIAIGNESFTDEQLMENVVCALHSLQGKIESAYMKYTMGPSVKII